jgi:hypothetical protein
MGPWLTQGDETRGQPAALSILITAAQVSATLPFVIPRSRLACCKLRALILPPAQATKVGVPHSSPVFGLEWDTQHSTRSLRLSLGAN